MSPSLGSSRVQSPSPMTSGRAASPATGPGASATRTASLKETAARMASSAALKAEKRKRDACESIRILVFGHAVHEGCKSIIFEQSIGTREQVWQLHLVWSQLDEDGSGDVTLDEFISFFSRNKADRILGMRCVKYLTSNSPGTTGVRLEDMMHLIWLKATRQDVDAMMQMLREAKFETNRVPTPPLMPPRRRREILDNFPEIKRSGNMTYLDLVENDVVSHSLAMDLKQQYDKNNSNLINKELLLEMMCPCGYRAHGGVDEAVDSLGRPIVRVTNEFSTGWVVRPEFLDD